MRIIGSESHVGQFSERLWVYKVRNTISIGMRHFGECRSKVMRAYTQSGQYHTIAENRDS